MAALALALPAGGAWAQQVALRPLIDARLRLEHAEQDGLPLEADAVTLRLRAGAEARHGRWTVLAEGEATAILNGAFNDGTNGRSQYPLVPDPPNLQLNRAQLRYAGGRGLVVTAGRQRIELADQRFVGSVAFRQNDQTFDAARIQWGRPDGLMLDVSYAGRVWTINGRNGEGGRPRSIGGDNVFALASHPSPIGTITAFAYRVDQDEAAVQQFRLSSRTYGLRVAGSAPVASGTRIGWIASIARQQDAGRNPNDYAATYLLAEATLSHAGFSATAGHERLGAADGRAITSFQFPLASPFRFNGWAAKFVTTPPDGLADWYGGVAHGWKKLAGLDSLTINAVYHHFDSDRLARPYGDELDVGIAAQSGRAQASLRYADYRADGFGADTRRLFATIEWTY
jgi:hypothetical protein